VSDDPPKPVLVEWVDATNVEGGSWISFDDVEEQLRLDAILHESVGYLVGESEYAIALAGSRSLYGSEHVPRIGGVETIPRAAIIRGPIELRPAATRRRRSPQMGHTKRERIRQTSEEKAP
jgi:hypothetical protein